MTQFVAYEGISKLYRIGRRTDIYDITDEKIANRNIVEADGE